MEPIHFPGVNVELAKDQPEYRTLPVMLFPIVTGDAIQKWQFTDEEIEEIVKNKGLYVSQMTFQQALQPIMVSPYLKHCFPAGFEQVIISELKKGDVLLMSKFTEQEVIGERAIVTSATEEGVTVGIECMKGMHFCYAADEVDKEYDGWRIVCKYITQSDED